MLYGHDQGKNIKQLCDGQTDAVCIAKGGTGATTAAGARENLGIGDVGTEDILPIAKGGTGATTAAGARQNLGIDAGGFTELWTNDTPDASFAAQNVTLHTSSETYRFYVVIGKLCDAMLVAGQAGRLSNYGSAQNTYCYVYTRGITITNGVAQFGDCYRKDTDSSQAGTKKNDTMQPLAIYGVA